jgi:hypothetical protein
VKKKATKKAATSKQPPEKRRVNRDGQRWTEERSGMTLRLPATVELEVRKYALAKGDLSLVILFALDHVPKTLEIVRTRKTGLELGRPMLLHIGAKARTLLRDWALAESVSVNAVVLSVLEEFFRLIRRKPKLDEELKLELRARRGI